MEPANLDTMNETDVREIIVRPLLGRLGYRHGTKATIRTEVSLRYGNAFLGRKKPSKDPPLSGRADYLCDYIPFVRCVVEVKAPTEELTQDDIEQAHTYAAHPEVAASYFLVTNGIDWRLFETSKLSDAVLSWVYDDTDNVLLKLFNILSPEALKARAHLTVPDSGEPLCKGLASRMEIIGGEVMYENHVSNHPLFRMSDINGLKLPITGGFVDRDEEGKIIARVHLASPIPMMQELRRALGEDDGFEFFSADAYVSTNIEAPTILKNFVERTMPPGTPIRLLGQGLIPSPFGLQAQSMTEAIGYFDGDRFRGTMEIAYEYLLFGMAPAVVQALTARFGNIPPRAHVTGGGTFEVPGQPAI